MGCTLNVLPVVTLWHAQLQNHCLSHDLIEFEIWNQPLGNLYVHYKWPHDRLPRSILILNFNGVMKCETTVGACGSGM